jgi:hypothetical protein
VRNFNELKDSSDNESSSVVTRTMLMIMMDEVSKYKCKKIQSTEIFELLAQWCQHEKDVPHLTKLAYFIHATLPSRATSDRSFTTAGPTIQDNTHLKPRATDIIFSNNNLKK